METGLRLRWLKVNVHDVYRLHRSHLQDKDRAPSGTNYFSCHVRYVLEDVLLPETVNTNLKRCKKSLKERNSRRVILALFAAQANLLELSAYDGMKRN